MKTLTKALFDSVVVEMENSLDSKGNHLDMVGLIVSQGETIFSDYFREREKIDIRSIPKPITCLALGQQLAKVYILKMFRLLWIQKLVLY